MVNVSRENGGNADGLATEHQAVTRTRLMVTNSLRNPRRDEATAARRTRLRRIAAKSVARICDGTRSLPPGSLLGYGECAMTDTKESSLERLLRPLREELSLELARALSTLRADDEIQRRYDELADKNTAVSLQPEEHDELESLVRANSLLSAVKVEARAILERTGTG